MAQVGQCDWTPEDTAICERAEANGYSFNLATGKPMILSELVELRKEYQQVKNTVPIEEFKKGKWEARPFVELGLL